VIDLHSDVWAVAVEDSAQIAMSTANGLISNSFWPSGTGHEKLAPR